MSTARAASPAASLSAGRGSGAPSRPVPEREASRVPLHTGAGGHSLGRIAIQPSLAPRPVAPPPAASSLALPSGAGVIQRASWWKKGLAGLGLVGGGIAAGLGTAALAATGLAAATTGAIAATALGGLGVLAGGGYLLHQALQRPAGEAELRELHAERERLHDSPHGSRRAFVRDLLDEGLGLVGREAQISSEPHRGGGGGDTARIGGQIGQYRVRLDPTVRDPTLRQAYLLHELIHASSDQSYRSNVAGHRDYQFLNVEGAFDQEQVGGEVGRRTERVDALRELARTDDSLSEAQRDHVRDRLAYLGSFSLVERDTVLTDLVYYLHQQGVDEASETHQHIVAWAREAYAARQREREAQR